MTVKYLPSNKHNKDYVIGDLHGHIDLLFDMIELVEFDFDNDRIISTGDLIDRGPRNRECILLIEQPWFHSVKGNHEQFMEYSFIDYVRRMWFANGGVWAATHILKDDWRDLVEMITTLPTAIVVGEGADRYNVVHAQPHHIKGTMTDAIFDKTPDPELDEPTLWSRHIFHYPDSFNITLSPTFVGHTPIKQLIRVGPIYFLDRAAHASHRTPTSCLTMACPQEQVIYEYYPITKQLKTTHMSDIPDMLTTMEEDYAA